MRRRRDPAASAIHRSFASKRLGTLLSQLDPTGLLFAHDKVEGVATGNAGKRLYLSNDDDFGIDVITHQASAALKSVTVTIPVH